MTKYDLSTPEGRARKRAKDFTGLVWHAVIYLLVNAFLWIQDIAAGDGVEYAMWTSIPWGIGLAFHAASYYLGDRGLEQRKYEQFLEEERQREAGSDTSHRELQDH